MTPKSSWEPPALWEVRVRDVDSPEAFHKLLHPPKRGGGVTIHKRIDTRQPSTVAPLDPNVPLATMTVLPSPERT